MELHNPQSLYSHCPHTGEELVFHPHLPHQFLVAPSTGTIYNTRVESHSYGPDYFLEEYESQYGKTYFSDEEHIRKISQQRLQTLMNYADDGMSLLETGCAVGFFLDEARKKGFQTTGLEISEYASRYAKENLELNVIHASFENWPSNEKVEERFDILAAFYVIEHLPHQNRVFEKISNLLNPGGFFVFTLPSTNGPLLKCHPGNWASSHPMDHVVDYSPGGLKKILPLYDLKLIHMEPASYHPERICGLMKNPFLKPFYKPFARWNVYGDTMFGIAKKSAQV